MPLEQWWERDFIVSRMMPYSVEHIMQNYTTIAQNYGFHDRGKFDIEKDLHYRLEVYRDHKHKTLVRRVEEEITVSVRTNSGDIEFFRKEKSV